MSIKMAWNTLHLESAGQHICRGHFDFVCLQTGTGSASVQSVAKTQTQVLGDSRSKGATAPQLGVPSAASAALPSSNRGNKLRPTGLTVSPSRLSRMTLQDAQTDEEEEPASRQPEPASGQLRKSSSVAGGLTSMGSFSSPKGQPGGKAGLQLGLSSTAADGQQVASGSTVHSPERDSHDSKADDAASDESADTAVPAWRSNSAAAWVKQKSLDKSPSGQVSADLNQPENEEEQRTWEQQAEPDQAHAPSPEPPAEESATAQGKGRALGSLHIEVEEQPPQDGLQEWTEPGLDDIASAVAQYTGASPHELHALTSTSQDHEQVLEQPPRQLRQIPKIANLRVAGSRSGTQSPRAAAGRQYATQQEQMDAEMEAAMAADAEAAAAPKYANAQEEMEAELEAAMAAEMGVPKYANAQEQMEAELEAAMAADAAASDDHAAQTGRESAVQYASQWEQMDAELDAAMAAEASAISAAAPWETPQHESPKGHTMQMLQLPGGGEGLDLDSDGLTLPEPHPQQQVSLTLSMAVALACFILAASLIPWLLVQVNTDDMTAPHSCIMCCGLTGKAYSLVIICAA